MTTVRGEKEYFNQMYRESIVSYQYIYIYIYICTFFRFQNRTRDCYDPKKSGKISKFIEVLSVVRLCGTVWKPYLRQSLCFLITQIILVFSWIFFIHFLIRRFKGVESLVFSLSWGRGSMLWVGLHFGSKKTDKISISFEDFSRNSVFLRTEVKP